MKIEKANKRDRAQRKRKHGMRVDGKGNRLIAEIIRKKGDRKADV